MSNRLVVRRSVGVTVMLAAMLSLATPLLAREHTAERGRAVPAAPSERPGPTDPAELEAFLDHLMAQDMDAHHVPGAAVSVVRDGRLLLAKGYGYADLELKVSIDPEQTIFPTGSVGKLFTWTAVMQLVEQGKLKLDADVNTYLDFRIPATYPEPITLKHLLTHTAGFEDRRFEVFALNAADLLPVGEWLATHIPARVRPPGEVPAYSNYGANLAGYIVARVSGQPYDEYIRQHIFDPLGMARSSAHLPLTPDLQPDVAQGYWYSGGAYQAVPRIPDDYLGQLAMTPAGGHLSSVTDMARFMVAHLQGGSSSDPTGGARILAEATAREMQRTLYAADPGLLGTAYGIFDFSDNGQRTLGHSGGTLGFATLLLLVPSQGLGVYVVYTNEDVGDLTTQHFGFQRAFFDHYLPAQAVAPIRPPADFGERAGRFTGSYKPTRSAYTTLEKLGTLMSRPTQISDPGDGTLLLTSGGAEMRLVEVAPLHFRQVDGPFGVVFREDDQGQIAFMFADVSPQFAYEKQSWYESASFNMPLLLGCLAIFLSVVPVALVGAIRNRRRRSDRKPVPPRARVAYQVILGVSVINLLFVLGVAWMVMFNFGFPLLGVSLAYRLMLGLGVLSALLTFAGLVFVVLAWKDRYWGVAFRSYYTLVAGSAVAFVWFLNSWNLLGWRF